MVATSQLVEFHHLGISVTAYVPRLRATPVQRWMGGRAEPGKVRYLYGVAHLWGNVETTCAACWVVVVDKKLVSQKKGRTCTRDTLDHV